ncbi:MAG: hypothetical protein ACYDDA_02065 [Acidiferrobacteraceae bacterium]
MTIIRPKPALIYSLLFGFLSVFYTAWVWSPALGGFGGDNAVYLLTAQWIRSGGADVIAGHYAAGSPYPPLYPLLLSIAGGGHSILAAHLVTAAALVAACGMFLLWLRASGVGPGEASLFTIAFALAPGIERQTLQILSEPLYLLLSLTALWAATRAERDDDARWTAGSALAVAAALMTRSAGIALWIAFVGWILFRRSRRELLLAAGALVPFALWALLHAHGSGYMHDLFAVYRAHPLDTLRQQVTTESLALRQGWYQDVSGWLLLPAFRAVAIALAVLGAIGIARRPLAFESLYLLIYLAMILVWPFPSEAARFLIVILPILMKLAARGLGNPRGPVRFAGITLACAMLAMVVPQWVFDVRRLAAPVPPGMTSFKHMIGWYQPDFREADVSLYAAAALTDMLRSLPELVPTGQCILNIKPSITALYAHRLSYAPPLGSTGPRTFYRTLTVEHCRYALLLAYGSPSFPGALYPLQRFHDEFGAHVQLLKGATLYTGRHAPLVSLLVKLPRFPHGAPVILSLPGHP